MLVDAAKAGDVEIPVFCYEPKLGEPVGACRMCLVEIEGIPKLQTACSTPVRDGMVVYTQTDRVKEAQNAVVEFLLVNHPLDCPVCDKGGECPLQDISMGWGPGKSRVTDPKRHFQKPIPLSPLIAIDRERCILCYRCVRFSQEVAEDEQLQLLERGAADLRRHLRRPPLRRPLPRQHHRALPGGRADLAAPTASAPGPGTSRTRARSARSARASATSSSRSATSRSCACSPATTRRSTTAGSATRAASASRCSAPPSGRPRRWCGPAAPSTRRPGRTRSTQAARGLTEARGKVAAIVGGGASNEEGYLVQRILRGALGSHDVARHPARRPCRRRRGWRSPTRRSPIAIADIDDADAILVVGTDPMHEMPILDLRIRKAVRRHGAELLVATERPTALDGGAAIDSAGALEAPATRRAGGRLPRRPRRRAARRSRGARAGVGLRRGPAGSRGRRRSSGASGSRAAPAARAPSPRCSRSPPRSASPSGPAAACSRSRAAPTAAACARSGCGRDAGPGLAPLPRSGRDADAIRDGARGRRARGADPLRTSIRSATSTIPRAGARADRRRQLPLSLLDVRQRQRPERRRHLPGRDPRREGGHRHPSRRPPAAGPPRRSPIPARSGRCWQALTELAPSSATRPASAPRRRSSSCSPPSPASTAASPTSEIGGTGIRWQEANPEAAARGRGSAPGARSRPVPELGGGALRLGTYHDLWADYVTERNPSLGFLSPDQTLEISEAAARALGVGNGDRGPRHRRQRQDRCSPTSRSGPGCPTAPPS